MFGGLFSRTPRVEALPDSVWMTHRARTAGLLAAAAEAAAGGVPFLLVSHFRDSGAAFRAALEAAGRKPREVALSGSWAGSAILDFARSGAGCGWGLWPDPPVPSEGAPPAALPEGVPGPRLAVVVAEHHPRLAQDEALRTMLSSLPVEGSYRFHSSLEDPLLSRFSGPDLRGLLERLGMKEGEALESPVLAGAIRSAQKKLEAQARDAGPAATMREWFERNLPGA